MDIFINNSKIAYTPEASALSWKDLFAHLLDHVLAPDHGIVRVVVDGIETNEYMGALSGRLIPETVRVIEITTKSKQAITNDSFLKARKLIDTVKNETARTADLYRRGKHEEASAKLVHQMDMIKALVQFVQSIGQNYSIRFDQLEFTPGQPLRGKIDTFLHSLEEMIGAQERKDYVELADFLEYQLSADMDAWSRIVDVLAAEVELLLAAEN